MKRETLQSLWETLKSFRIVSENTFYYKPHENAHGVFCGKKLIRSFPDKSSAQKTVTQHNALGMIMATEENSPSQREQGTDSLTNIYAADTPGQRVSWKKLKSLNSRASNRKTNNVS